MVMMFKVGWQAPKELGGGLWTFKAPHRWFGRRAVSCNREFFHIICTEDSNSDTIRYAHENMDQGRHYRVLKALVADEDSDVACCELPVWGEIKDEGKLIEHTGHIDAVEIKNGGVHVLDYKPRSDSPHNHARQIEAYRKLLTLKVQSEEIGQPCPQGIGVGIFNDEKIWRCNHPPETSGE
ncbi:hypothetical protein AKJ51_03550 [candidate division MSBL1 archaeon SCGC-AAA382A20]|uniref:PD-(D/E)XK endonuclease-like domain-containing protein n=1 Tax=candidate division MSBL1 archaeon SCGC-AAA382A20 TaxID=1698280 RepID=A0A133VJD5_9EURY|nr:hypothetical protein AKJ51_03550 [candidate division MSBL1 archaeon SCGC-AAA382A20]